MDVKEDRIHLAVYALRRFILGACAGLVVSAFVVGWIADPACGEITANQYWFIGLSSLFMGFNEAVREDDDGE